MEKNFSKWSNQQCGAFCKIMNKSSGQLSNIKSLERPQKTTIVDD